MIPQTSPPSSETPIPYSARFLLNTPWSFAVRLANSWYSFSFMPLLSFSIVHIPLICFGLTIHLALIQSLWRKGYNPSPTSVLSPLSIHLAIVLVGVLLHFHICIRLGILPKGIFEVIVFLLHLQNS